jgi:hypothetical protein
VELQYSRICLLLWLPPNGGETKFRVEGLNLDWNESGTFEYTESLQVYYKHKASQRDTSFIMTLSPRPIKRSPGAGGNFPQSRLKVLQFLGNIEAGRAYSAGVSLSRRPGSLPSSHKSRSEDIPILQSN